MEENTIESENEAVRDKAKVLVVDDVPQNIAVLEMLLEPVDAVILRASSGMEALEVAANHKDLALVLLDVQMPEMDGFEVAERLHRSEATYHIPIILITAFYKDIQHQLRGYQVGALDYIEKPIDGRILQQKVQVFLDLFSQKRELHLALFKLEHRNQQYLQEISERRQAQQDLAQSALEWTYAVDFFKDAILLADLEDRLVRANRVFYTLTGLAPEKVIGQSLTSIFCPEPNAKECPLCLARSERRDLQLVLESDHPSNPSQRPLEVTVRVIWEETRTPLGIMMYLVDLSQRRATERAIREREQQVRDLLESTAEAIYGLDLQGRCTFANPTCAKILGYQNTEQLIGQNMHQLAHHSHPEGTPYSVSEWPVLKALQQGKRVHVDHEVLWRADGSHFPAEYWSNPIRRDEKVIGSVVTFLDISERRAIEEALCRTQKIDAIGQLTGGIAHDFNNLLGIIIGNLDLLARLVQDNKLAGKRVDTASKAALRGADLTRQLLAFSRSQKLGTTQININPLIKGMNELIIRSITPGVEVEILLANKLWPVRIAPGELEDALLNLILNARDAMPEGGKLTIRTANKILDLDSDYVRLNPEATAGKYVQLTIGDTGSGMSEEVLERAFDPFFTTKSSGKGTGLGLSMVYGFFKRNQGHINIHSEPKVGSIFHCYLPRCIGTDDVPRNKTFFDSEVPRGNEQILVVDDEIDLGRLAVDYLKDLGYQTYLATSGEQALALLTQNSDIDLMFSDVVMPGMNGYELAEQAVAKKSKLKVLLTSGFTRQATTKAGQAQFRSKLLTKPYRKADLAQRIRQKLENS